MMKKTGFGNTRFKIETQRTEQIVESFNTEESPNSRRKKVASDGIRVVNAARLKRKRRERKTWERMGSSWHMRWEMTGEGAQATFRGEYVACVMTYFGC